VPLGLPPRGYGQPDIISDRLTFMSLPAPLSATGGRVLQAIIDAPSDTLIATDFDGTLAPIVDDPAQAYADPRAVAGLGRLGEHVGAIAVITGRPAPAVVVICRLREVAGLC
jgi:trehalose 6-phosphate phosphatase